MRVDGVEAADAGGNRTGVPAFQIIVLVSTEQLCIKPGFVQLLALGLPRFHMQLSPNPSLIIVSGGLRSSPAAAFVDLAFRDI